LCGTGHYTMRGYVVVEEDSAHQAWLQEQPTFAELLAQAENGTGDVANLVSREGKSDPAARGLAR